MRARLAGALACCCLSMQAALSAPEGKLRSPLLSSCSLLPGLHTGSPLGRPLNAGLPRLPQQRCAKSGRGLPTCVLSRLVASPAVAMAASSARPMCCSSARRRRPAACAPHMASSGRPAVSSGTDQSGTASPSVGWLYWNTCRAGAGGLARGIKCV